MFKILLLSILLILTNIGFSQVVKETNTPKQVRSIDENWSFPSIEGYDGSYQFIVKEKKNFLISSETIELIANSRKQETTSVLILNSFLEVHILSELQVKSPSFTPFQQVYILQP